MPEPRPRRQCRDYERAWRGHCVDQNLADGWLEALNALEAFRLISICEGHASDASHSLRSRPHINLRLKPSLLPTAIASWDSLSSAIAGIEATRFDFGSTSVTVEIKQQVRLEPGGPSLRQDLSARIEARRPRNGPSMDAETFDWFQHAVECVKEFDRFVLDRLQAGGGTA